MIDADEDTAIDPNPYSPSSRINVVEGGLEELAARIGSLEDGEWLPMPVAYLIIGQIVTTGALVGWMLGRYLRGS